MAQAQLRFHCGLQLWLGFSDCGLAVPSGDHLSGPGRERGLNLKTLDQMCLLVGWCPTLGRTLIWCPTLGRTLISLSASSSARCVYGYAQQSMQKDITLTPSHSLFVSHSLRGLGVGRLSSPPLPRGLWDCCQLLRRSRHLAGQGAARRYHISAVPFPICVPFPSRVRSWASVRSAAA